MIKKICDKCGKDLQEQFYQTVKINGGPVPDKIQEFQLCDMCTVDLSNWFKTPRKTLL